MLIQSVDNEHPNRALFEDYRNLHAAVAGRVTRGQESWDAMFEAITSGHGDLVLARLNGDLVSGTLVLDGGDIAYYASGAYDRNQFDKPLAHWPLFSAILRAKARGRRIFDVGEVAGSDSVFSDKEVAIAYFKRGFSSQCSANVVWTWSAVMGELE